MLNIAPFAYKTDADDDAAIELQWEEPRDLVRVVLRFPPGTALPAPADVRLTYWRHLWPHTRAEAAGATRWSGWESQDDWHNGEWQTADTTAETRPDALAFSFRPLAEAEFAGLRDYSVQFRRTMKLRVSVPEGCERPAAVEALTESALAEAEMCIDWDRVTRGEGRLEAYNCEVISLAPLSDAAAPKVLDPTRWRADGSGPCGLRVRLRYAAGRDESHPDRSILTVRCPGRGFSFLVEPVARGEAIHAPTLGARVWDASLGDTPPPLARGQTIHERVSSMPEQTYRRARGAMPPRRPFYFVLGCEGTRQKFRIEPDGDISCPPNYVARVPGRDTPRMKGEGTASYRFGLERLLPTGRFVEEGWLPIVHGSWMKGALRVEQTAFAAPVHGSALGGELAADHPIAAFVRFRFLNTGDEPATATLPISAIRETSDATTGAPVESQEPLLLDGDLAFASAPEAGERWLRMIVACERGRLTDIGGRLAYEADLGPGMSSDLVLKLPFVALDDPRHIEELRSKEFDGEHGEVSRFWRERTADGCEIETPEQDINDFHRAHLVHMLITNDREIGSDRIMTRVGALNYGNCANESCMCISDLDRRGYGALAERALDAFLHYQGTAAMNGDFSTREGEFFGSGGYEHHGGENYIQGHGWVLWCLAEHYWYTRDAEWLARAAPSIVEGCEWIVRERQATKRARAGGEPALEWGLLPPGGLEDVGDWHYWLSNNVFNWWGLRAAAGALTAIDDSDGPRLMAEAESYGEDILRAFREARLRSPLVRLRDGTYVPHTPSRLYLRGRDQGWIRETLEGAIHLICTGLIAPDGDEAAWTLNDYEDNRYLSARYGYALEDEARWWFDRGGFSQQPNLLWGPIAYFMRDEVAHYLRAYFNSLAVAFREDTRMLTEHPLPTFSDWAGDHFKASDEAQSTYWLRLMFIQESGDEMHLGRLLPRAWLADGSRVAIRRAMTHFGRMSMVIESALSRGEIAIDLDPPRRNPPSRVRLRLRHPDGAAIGAVEVNGGRDSSYVVEGEWIIFPAPSGPVRIVVRY